MGGGGGKKWEEGGRGGKGEGLRCRNRGRGKMECCVLVGVWGGGVGMEDEGKMQRGYVGGGWQKTRAWGSFGRVQI